MLGLPVIVHLDGKAEPQTFELVDICEGGVRFGGARDDVQIGQRAAFGFIVPGDCACAAEGRVVRVDGGGQFVVVLDQANEVFRRFVNVLDGDESESDPPAATAGAGRGISR